MVDAKIQWLTAASSTVTSHGNGLNTQAAGLEQRRPTRQAVGDPHRKRGREAPPTVPSTHKGDDASSAKTQVGDKAAKRSSETQRKESARDSPPPSEGPMPSHDSEPQKEQIFKKIFFINMDKDVKRRAHMEDELRKHAANVPVERIPGPDPSTMRGLENYQRLMPRGCCADKSSDTKCHNENADEQFKLRSCACDLAHRIGYEMIASQQDDGYYLLLEDDVAFSGSSWLSDAKMSLQHAPPNWDILRLGFWGDSSDSHKIPGHQQWYESERVDTNGQGWPNFKGYYGAHAIVMTPFTAQKFLTKHVVSAAGDYADAFTGNAPGLKSYVSVKNLIVPAPKEKKDLGSSRADGTINRLMVGQHFEEDGPTA